MDRHHNAPPLAERLEIEHANLAAKAVECAEMVPDTLAPVATDEDAGAYAETAKTLKACLTAIETARKKEKDQILKDGRAIDGHFAMMPFGATWNPPGVNSPFRTTSASSPGRSLNVSGTTPL
jgi:hypothetical protein